MTAPMRLIAIQLPLLALANAWLAPACAASSRAPATMTFDDNGGDASPLGWTRATARRRAQHDDVARQRLQAFAFAGGKGPACRPSTQYGRAGNYSLFVFQQCWAAGFCNAEHTSGCTAPTDFMRSHLVVHGVWPTYDVIRDGHVGPQCCDSPFGPHLPAAAIASQRAELERNWPGMGTHPHSRVPGRGPLGMWEHEWSKHGTCSGKNQAHYFGTSLALQRAMPMPPVVRDAIGGTIAYTTLLAAYWPDRKLRAEQADGDEDGGDGAETDANANVDGDGDGDGDVAAEGDDADVDGGDGFDVAEAQQWVGFECRVPRATPHQLVQRHVRGGRGGGNGSGSGNGDVQELMHVTTCWSRDEQTRVRCPDWILHAQRGVRCVDGPVRIPTFPDADTEVDADADATPIRRKRSKATART